MYSRALSCVKTVKFLANLRNNAPQQVRNSHHWNYRTAVDPPKSHVLAADLLQGFGWWWVMWHLVTEPGHVFGEWEYPDASKWTNEELGIPDN